MPEQRNIVIIGGGVIGLSLAYHLAKKGAEDILLLERNQMTSGTTWHAAGIVGPLRSTYNMTKLASKALQTFPELERETGLATGYQQTTGYWIARRPERMDELHRIHAMAEYTGMTPEMISGGEVAARVPGISAEGIHGALRLKEDGQVNPVDLTMAYAKGARSRGVEIREGISVARLLQEDGKVAGVELVDGTQIHANQVALCAGAWSKKLADEAGVVLPQHAVKHMYVVTEPIEGFPKPFPVFPRHGNPRLYEGGRRQAAGRLVRDGRQTLGSAWRRGRPVVFGDGGRLGAGGAFHRGCFDHVSRA